MLLSLGGLPGVGKTTLARGLAQRTGAVHLRVDTIEQALRSWNAGDVGPAGYLVAYAVAEDNLRLGRMVIADSVNPLAVTRDAWRAVAERASARLVEIEVICSDPALHRRRVETRTTDIDGLVLPTWQAVLDRDYARWDRPRIELDTARATVEENVTEFMTRLGLAP